MRILCDRNVEPKYIDAIAALSGITVVQADDRFLQTAPDRRIAEFADREGWVVFTRDDDFFKVGRNQEIELLFFSQRHNTPASEIASAVDAIEVTTTMNQPPSAS